MNKQNKGNRTSKNDSSALNIRKNYDNYYKCYSVKLNAFLKSHGLEVVKETRHSKTNKIAFIYEKNKELDELLTVWTNNKDKN